jgi:hypothetical protein
MPEYLNSNRNKTLTQAEVDAYVADEKDLKPFSGAGSMDGRWRIGQRGNRPMSAREQMEHKERAAFAAANPDPVATRPLTAEERAWAEQTAKQTAEEVAFYDYLRETIKSGKPLEFAWSQTFGDKPCPFFNDVPRSMDNEDFNNENVGVAAKFLRDSEMFAAYKSSGDNPRTDHMFKVFEILLEAIHQNYLDATSPQSWLRIFRTLQKLDLLPAPLPTQAELDNRPADDGNPCALRPDGSVVTYVIRGKEVRYSQQMLEALTSAGYETVMSLKRVGGKYGTGDPATRRALAVAAAQEAQTNRATCEDGNPVAIMDGEPFVVNGKAYSNQMIDKLSGDEYRLLMRLPRTNNRQGAAQS